MNERQLIDALGQLPKAIEPPVDPWAKIESQLGSNRRSRWPVLGLAAILVAAIAVAFVVRQQPAADGSEPTVVAAPTGAEEGAPAPAPVEGPGRAYAAFLDAEYGGAMRELARAQTDEDLVVEDTDKDAELRAAFADIAAAQRRLRDRLADDPDNLQLASLLALTHRQQARSLRALATTETSS